MNALAEYNMILFVKVYPMIFTIILAIQMFPQLDFTLPIPFSDQLFLFFIWYGGGLNFAEFLGLWEENKKRIAGLTFSAFFPLVLFVIGLALGFYIILTPYEYNDGNINQWIAIYLAISALSIFWFAKEQIFFHKALKAEARKRFGK